MDNLLERLRDEDERAVKELMKLTYSHCKWAVLNRDGTDDDAKEVFQEAIISLLEKVKQSDFKVDSSKAYLYNTCKYIWFAKKRKRAKESVITGEIQGEIVGEDHLIWKTAKERRLKAMYDGLDQLEDKCKELLELFFFEQLSDKEIAPIMDYKVAFVRVKRNRCIERLRGFVKS